jgi:hypothetical protein
MRFFALSIPLHKYLMSHKPLRKMAPLAVLLLGVFSPSLHAQKRITISGYVEDLASRERLIGVNVLASELRAGTTTNNFGFFSLSLPEGTHTISFSYLGYDSYVFNWQAQKDTILTIRLTEYTTMLSEAVVTAEIPLSEQAQMSTIEVNMKQLKMVPALFGEVDLLRVLQLLPGVQSGGEGSTGIYVRGGGPDQNLILLDGVPLYNVSHLFGFFSVFNADAIKSTTLIKGGFPARYGGRLSSVIDITMKEGDMQQRGGDVSIGLIASKITYEGPIVKDKTSFMISGRRTYIDALAQPVIRMVEPGTRAGYYFGDFNLKVNHKFGDKDRLYLSFFNNIDKFYFGFKESGAGFEESVSGSLQWGNRAAALRWNHLFNPRMFVNVAATYTRYQLSIQTEIKENDDFFQLRLSSNIEDFGLKADWEYFPNPQNHVRFGGNIVRHYFRPAAVNVKENFSGVNTDSLINLSPVLSSWDFQFYAENDHKITERIRANYGLHYNYYRFKDIYYHSLQPRLSTRYRLDNRSAIKASFARMQQYLHLLSSNNGIGLPSDLWVPATDLIPPMMADQVAAGYVINSRDNVWEFSVESFYKKMNGLIEFSSGSSFLVVNDWQSRVEVDGQGWAYGTEFFLQKKSGKNMGWVGYTLSWNNRQFENLNNGNVYPYRFDRRHDVSIVYTRQIGKSFDFSCTWVYGTGLATNIPIFSHQTLGDMDWGFFGDGAVSNYGDLNSYRFRPYHRGDISLNFNKVYTKTITTWNVSIYNVYNRQNPFFLFRDTENGQPVLKQVSLFPILPSISYRVKF